MSRSPSRLAENMPARLSLPTEGVSAGGGATMIPRDPASETGVRQDKVVSRGEIAVIAVAGGGLLALVISAVVARRRARDTRRRRDQR
ncbi:hypothetical protein [Kocuria sp. KH4]